MNPVLSILILSYNTREITLDCLHSILEDKGLAQTPFEIIIVDNASTDHSPDAIDQFFQTKNFSQYTLIRNSHNLGFAKANNQAAKIAKGNYLLLLNSDTIILHSAISQALDWLCSNPQASACTAQLLNSDKTIQPTGGFFPNIGNFVAWITHFDDLPFTNSFIKPIHPHPPQFYTHDTFYLKDRLLDWITGAFMLIRKPIFTQLGGFDESYFMYGEELELFYRLRLNFPKSEVWYLVGPQIIHIGGASSNKANAVRKENEGMVSFFRKHKPHWQYQLVKTLLNL